MSVIKDSPIFATANNSTVTVTNATNVSVLASGGSVTIRTADLRAILFITCLGNKKQVDNIMIGVNNHIRITQVMGSKNAN